MSVSVTKSNWWNVQRKVDNFESSQAVYDSWSNVYDQDAAINGYFTGLPQIAAELCLKYVKNAPDTTVLDVGAGTAAVGQILRKKEAFAGQIDILDANMEMLHVASKKEMNWRNIICHAVSGQLPLRRNSYDAVLCVGSLLPNNCPPVTVQAMLDVVKPDGHLLISVRPTIDKDYDELLKSIIGDLTSSSKMSLVEKSSKSTTYDTGAAFMYVYKKNRVD